MSYSSASKAAEILGISDSSISSAIRKRSRMVKESYWRYGKPQTFIDVSEFENKRERYFLTLPKSLFKN